MKLTDWAKSSGISYKTALRWFHAGILPVAAQRLQTGTIWVEPSPLSIASAGIGPAVLYARVSSHDQRKDLEAQVGRLAAFASAQGIVVKHVVTEIGSGLNGHRPRLLKVLGDPAAVIIVVEHRDRLMRFGSECVEAALKAQGRTLLVIDTALSQPEMKDDLVQDMIDVLTSFCARLYGRRSARNRAKKALEAINVHE